MKIRAPDDEGIQAENMKNETDDSSTKVWQEMLFRLIVSSSLVMGTSNEN